MMEGKKKANCYECKFRGEVPGSAHSCCKHPGSGNDGDPFIKLMAIFAGVGRHAPIGNHEGIRKLNIRGNPHGIRMGWFNWPYNFDPTWLENCDGFTHGK
jgi:hypothetical protein